MAGADNRARRVRPPQRGQTGSGADMDCILSNVDRQSKHSKSYTGMTHSSMQFLSRLNLSRQPYAQRGGCLPLTFIDAAVGCVTARFTADLCGARKRRNSVSHIQPLMVVSFGING